MVFKAERYGNDNYEKVTPMLNEENVQTLLIIGGSVISLLLFVIFMNRLITYLIDVWHAKIFKKVRGFMVKTGMHIFVLLWAGLAIYSIFWLGPSENLMSLVNDSFTGQVFKGNISEFFRRDMGIAFLSAFAIILISWIAGPFVSLIIITVPTIFSVYRIHYILSESKSITWETGLSIAAVIVVALIIMILSSTFVREAATYISSGAGYALRNIFHIIPVVFICTLIFGLQASILLTIVNSFSGNSLVFTAAVFLALWTWHSLLYFVKLYTSVVYEISASSESSDEFVMYKALCRTFKVWKYAFYFGLFPAIFDFLIHAITLIIRSEETMIEYVSRTGAAATFVSVLKVVLGIFMYILRFVRSMIVVFKHMFELNAEIGVVHLGMNAHKYDIKVLDNQIGEFDPKTLSSVKSLVDGTSFMSFFRTFCASSFTILTFVVNSGSIMAALHANNLSTALMESMLAFNITEVIQLGSAGLSGPVVTVGMFVFILMATTACIFTGAIFSKMLAHREKGVYTSEDLTYGMVRMDYEREYAMYETKYENDYAGKHQPTDAHNMKSRNGTAGGEGLYRRSRTKKLPMTGGSAPAG